MASAVGAFCLGRTLQQQPGIPLNAQTGNQLMSALTQSSPPQNQKTPDDRMSDDTKRLEQYHKIRAVLKYISDEQLEEDPIFTGINAAFRLAVTQMLLSAEPSFVIAELTRHVGAIAPAGGAGMPGPAPQMPAPGTTPMPQMGAGGPPAPGAQPAPAGV